MNDPTPPIEMNANKPLLYACETRHGDAVVRVESPDFIGLIDLMRAANMIDMAAYEWAVATGKDRAEKKSHDDAIHSFTSRSARMKYVAACKAGDALLLNARVVMPEIE